MGNRGIGGFPYYPAQAHTKDEVVKAIHKKQEELKRELSFFDDGLRKIASLEEKAFYELTYLGEMTFFVQCWKFGRDHAEFRILSSSFTLEQVRAKSGILRSGGDMLSFVGTGARCNRDRSPDLLSDLFLLPVYQRWKALLPAMSQRKRDQSSV